MVAVNCQSRFNVAFKRHQPFKWRYKAKSNAWSEVTVAYLLLLKSGQQMAKARLSSHESEGMATIDVFVNLDLLRL